MRRTFLVLVTAALLAALGLFGAGASSAEPSDACGDAPVATGTDGSSSLSVCAAGVGATTAAQKGEDDGYVIADGDSDSPLTQASSCFGGHAGVQFVDGQPQPVAEAEGDYTYPGQPAGDPDPSACN